MDRVQGRYRDRADSRDRDRPGRGDDSRDCGRHGDRDRRDRERHDRHRDRIHRRTDRSDTDRGRRSPRRHRSRSRSRSRDRPSRRRRTSRSRSRSRDRPSRRRRTSRSRSRSRDRPSRRRSRSRSRSRDRGARREKPGEDPARANKSRDDGDEEAGDGSDESFQPSAPQCCNMLCEMYAEKQSLPAGVLSQCFSSEPELRLSRLSSGAVVARGAEPVVSALMAAPQAKPRPSRTLFVEPASTSGGPSLALAFFPAGAAPGFTHTGLAKGRPNERPVALLLRVQSGKINYIWVAEDADGLASEDSSIGRAELVRSGIWQDVVAVINDSLAEPQAAKLHLNNYSISTDGAGLGIGETSASETFSLSSM